LLPTASRDLVATFDGYSLHAQTRAGAEDAKGRLALYKYILRPPIAHERVQMRSDGLVQIALKKNFSDGTYAVALDPPPAEPTNKPDDAQDDKPGFRHWKRAELLKKTFQVDVMKCPSCEGKMKLMAMVQQPKSIRRFLDALGEPTHVPEPSPARAPPYFRSKALRLRLGRDQAAE